MLCRAFHSGLAVCLVLANGMAGTAAAGAGPVTPDMRTQYDLQQWTAEDGLPQNTVTRLVQTRDGYLWIGTRAGLARFDGVKFTLFMRELQIDDDDALSCEKMIEDGEGALWIRLPAVLVRYKNGHFDRYSLAGQPRGNTPALVSGDAIYDVTTCQRGGLWIITSTGLKRFENGRYTRAYGVADGLATDQIRSLREDHAGRLWIGCGSPGSGAVRSYQRLDSHTGELIDLPGTPKPPGSDLGNLFVHRSGRLWLASAGKLCRWDETQWVCFSFPPEIEPRGNPTLQEDAWGALWFSPAPGKLLRFHHERFEEFSVADGLADTDIRVLLPDREGNLWVGMGFAGLQQLRPKGLLTLFGSKTNGSRREIFSASAGPDATMWFATGGSLLRWKDTQSTNETDELPGNGAHAILADRNGQVWLACRERGLFTLADGEITRVSAADVGSTNYSVRGLHEDRFGRLWISTSDGLLERRADRFIRYGTQEGLSDNEINGVLDAPDGSLWVGTLAGGINHFKDGHFRAYTVREGLLSNRAMPLRVEDDGTVWVGTDEQGLNRIRNGQIRAVTQKEGLFDNFVYSLLDDGAGRYWAHGNRGIFRMNKADLHAVADGQLPRLQCIHYGSADGMASVEANGDYQPSACRSPDGRLWFPTTRGVVVLDPAALAAVEVPPLVQIEQVKANGEVIHGDGLKTPISKTRAATVKLPAGRARVLEIHYTANSFTDPQRVRFRYRLVGHDRDWRETTTERVAYYADIRPGDYRFEVNAANAHGLWTTSPAAFPFYLAPHFWQTWPFYISCAVAVVLASLGLHHRRIRVLRRIELLEREQALQAERARIARDLHDDLGANLTGIALKADLAQRQLDASPSASSQLAVIAASTRALVDNMRETVWALNPKHDTLESLARFLAQQAEDYVSSAGLRCRLDLPDSLPPAVVPSPARHQIHLLVKEALHNAIKHAGASEVQFSLRLEGQELCLGIADDGQGFESKKGDAIAPADCGNGLPNMRHRAESMGGELSLETRPGEGARVTIRISLQSFESLL